MVTNKKETEPEQGKTVSEKKTDETERLSEEQAEEEAYVNQETVNELDGALVDEDLDDKNNNASDSQQDAASEPVKEALEVSEEPRETEETKVAEEKEEAEETLQNGEIDLKQASELAKKKLSDALNKPANATISIENTGDNWLALVEIVEEEYLPGQNLKSMNDLLGVYEVNLSHQGELLKWTRKGSYKRAEMK
jgi:hypothetical protein